MITSTDKAWLRNYQPLSRKLTGPDDFGDDRSVGAHLKRRDSNAFYREDGFGIYLGQYPDNQWVVGIKNILFVVISYEIYDSLDELKREWQLD